MAGFLPGDPSQHGVYEGGIYKASQDKQEEGAGKWYFSRKEIEENSPSRQDGIDLKKETYLRKSYCTFLQDLGMRLKVPQVTIATAIIFCHRFFLRQSHAKNDRRTIATVCMFLAGKVEETPRPLKDVIMVSYEIIHKKDPAVSQRIKQKEVYEQQKELILLGERVVLATLAFDLNVHHPYKPLVEAIKKFKVAQNALAQVAWNFVNDGLRTSLCLQFKPHHIAAGAIFLAAKFLKVKLPSDGEKVWWQEFDVTPRQLEEVSNQMLELYEQNRVPPSQASEAEGSAGGSHRPSSKAPVASEENVSSYPQSSGATSKMGIPKPPSCRSVNDQPIMENPAGGVRGAYNRNNDYGNSETHSLPEHKGDEINNSHHHEREQFHHQGNSGEVNTSRVGSEAYVEEELEKNAGRIETRDAGEFKDKYHGRMLEHKDGAVGQSPQDFKKQLGDKVKAVREKRKKLGPEVPLKTDFLDEEEMIERQLEDEIVLENPRSDREKRQRSKSLNRSEHDNVHHDEVVDGRYPVTKGQTSYGEDFDNVEEGEVEFDDADRGYPSPKSVNRKRKAGSPVDKTIDGKRHDYLAGSQKHGHSDFPEDSRRMGRLSYSERDHKRHVQENHV